VLHRLGVPLSDLERFEGTGASSPVYSLLCILGDRDVDAAQALSTAQYLQDQGAPWGEALADALDD
jgi:hypothetical protein